MKSEIKKITKNQVQDIIMEIILHIKNGGTYTDEAMKAYWGSRDER